MANYELSFTGGGAQALLSQENNTVDYIIEQGVSGEWEYRKWNSGRVELWGNHWWTLTSTGNYWWGTLSLPFEVYPSPATNGIVNVQISGNNASLHSLYTDIGRDEVVKDFQTAATVVNHTVSCNASYYFMGYWKKP